MIQVLSFRHRLASLLLLAPGVERRQRRRRASALSAAGSPKYLLVRNLNHK